MLPQTQPYNLNPGRLTPSIQDILQLRLLIALIQSVAHHQVLVVQELPIVIICLLVLS